MEQYRCRECGNKNDANLMVNAKVNVKATINQSTGKAAQLEILGPGIEFNGFDIAKCSCCGYEDCISEFEIVNQIEGEIEKALE